MCARPLPSSNCTADYDRNMFQLAEVTSSRTSATSSATHAAWLSHALLKVLFARDSTVLKSKEFLAFCEGLNVPVPSTTAGLHLVAVCRDSAISFKFKSADCTQSITDKLVQDRSDLPKFVLGWYDRHITNAQNFIDNHISFLFTKKQSRKGKERDTGVVPDDSGLEKIQRIGEHLFAKRFKRYLAGHGHPDHPLLHEAGLLSPEEFAAQVMITVCSFRQVSQLTLLPFPGPVCNNSCGDIIASDNRLRHAPC